MDNPKSLFNNNTKILKKFKKGVDKEYGLWYYKNVPRNE